MQTLTGRVAIVSGSTSGIGLAISKELSLRGAYIIINYPYKSMYSKATAIAKSLSIRFIAACADISTINGLKALVKAAVREFGRIDILVNNAALGVNALFEDQTMDDWDRLVNLNRRGTFLIQHVLPYLTRGSGRIVNICSVSSRGPPPLQTIHAGTKGMVNSFMRLWAKELLPKYGCTVNAVAPGLTATEGFLGAGKEALDML